MIINGQEFSDTMIVRIDRAIKSKKGMTRSKLSRLVCEWLNWRSPNGKLKELSCRKALIKLEDAGLIKLPPISREVIGRLGRDDVSKKTILTIPAIKSNLKELGKIDLLHVTARQRQESQIWNEMMDSYHYLGRGPLCGAQIRYLIRSERHGYLGGMAFSACAWRVKPRDVWIGWSDEVRRENLNLVIGNSRFLIVPHVEVKNLASHVLAKSIQRISLDWEKLYEYKPLLVETFVEKGKFEGTSYKAANWQHIGVTSGRGRQDRAHAQSVPVKDMYVYPLTEKAREILCKSKNCPPSAPKRRERPCFSDWTEEEFYGIDLGDKRLNKRLLSISRDLYARTQANIPQACGTRAKTKAAYRFFSNKQVTMENILKPHFEATTERMEKEKVILAVQDTTSLNYSSHPMTKGLGLIGYSKNGPIGLNLHITMSFNVEGTPLGLLDSQCWSRDADDFGKKKQRHQKPIEEKESYKWLRSYKEASKAQKLCADTMVVSVGDRESDIYELFHLGKNTPSGAKILVRASHDRTLADNKKLWEKMSSEPVQGIQELELPRRKGNPSRIIRLEVRSSAIILKPPTRKRNLPALSLWAVYAKEEGSIAKGDGIEWMLLTDIPIKSFDDAIEKLSWYTLRWGIEVYFKTLKSGCKIEQRQLGSAENIKSCLALDLVVAWRIYYLAKFGRENPDIPCTVYFEEEEWKALTAFVTEDPIIPASVPSLRDVIRMVSGLGGFLGRNGDGEPGTKSLWLGLQRLDDITTTWKVVMKYFTVSSSSGYG